MPIQWSGRITSPQQLASVIQGEAATPDGQFAVASVMYNRMTNAGPYVGGGSGDITQVVLPTQFNGFNANPSANAQNLANALWNGQPPPGGSTGNATFFAAPVQGNAAWAAPGSPLYTSPNSVNIGGNYYSDRLGGPSANFQAPSYTGAGTTIANGTGTNSGFGGNGDSVSSAGPYDPYAGDYTSTYPDPNTAFQTTPSTTSPSTSGVTPGASAATTSGTNAPNTNASGGATGTPIQTSLQPEETSFITSTVQGIEKAFGAGTQAVITAASNAVGTAFAGLANWFARGFLIILGIIILAIALIVLLWDRGGKETVVNMGRMAAA